MKNFKVTLHIPDSFCPFKDENYFSSLVEALAHAEKEHNLWERKIQISELSWENLQDGATIEIKEEK